MSIVDICGDFPQKAVNFSRLLNALVYGPVSSFLRQISILLHSSRQISPFTLRFCHGTFDIIARWIKCPDDYSQKHGKKNKNGLWALSVYLFRSQQRDRDVFCALFTWQRIASYYSEWLKWRKEMWRSKETSLPPRQLPVARGGLSMPLCIWSNVDC